LVTILMTVRDGILNNLPAAWLYTTK
jgi:hypothetical protein